MITVHKIEASSATSYAEYLTSTSARADYYTSDGKLDPNLDVPSKWHGSEKVLKDLGLSSDETVTTQDLVTVMNGLNPRTREPLRPAGSNGERVAGIELMMAPPKTVSALWATASPEHREQIEAAHHQAVASTLQRTEREIALVRRKTKGVVRFEKAKNLLAAELVHTSSRLAKDQERGGIPDPQLHSHVILFAAERQDGKLAAIESKQLYKTARENGAWYRAELAANLQELGLQIERRTGNGERYFEVAGVPEDLASYWSKRAEDIHRAANLFRQRYGREPRAGELGSLTTKTRGSKSAASNLDINHGWRTFGAERGLSAEQNEGLFDERTIDSQRHVHLREELLTEVTRERSMINDHELKAKAYELSVGVGRPEEGDRLIEELVRSGDLLELEDHTWTTREHRQLERETIDIAHRRASEIAAPVSEQSLQQAQREMEARLKAPLSQEQLDALRTITGPGGMSLLVGRAGTGKGVVISTAARAWQLESYEVIGTAIAGSRAQQLKDEAKLDKAYTAEKLIRGLEKGRIEIGPNTIVVMDEAAMADTVRENRLAKLTNRAGSKYLGAGDSAQLPSIGAGGVYKELEHRIPTAELTEVHRARHEWERKAWEQIRAGEPGPALAAYKAHDRLHIHDTRAEAAEAMVDNWDRVRKDFPDGQAVMITDASNLERDQMNAMAQERRAEAGELGSRRVELPGKPYGLASGDEVIFSAQFHIPGEERIENGIEGTVIDTGRRKDRVTIRTKELEPRHVRVDTSKFSELSLSYAVHINKGQGITAETSGVLFGGWQTDKEHAYVDVSRAREQTQVYVSREDLGEEGFDTGAMERLAERMKRSRAQEASITRQLAHERPEPDRSPERSQRNEPSTQSTEPRVQRPTQNRSPSNARRGSEREIDEVVKARRQRQLEGERAIDVDRSSTFDEHTKEVDTIQRLAEQLRGGGASEASITKHIAKQTEGPDAGLERKTKAQREHESHIDRILEPQRRRLRAAELPRDIYRDQDADRSTDERPPRTAEPDPSRDPVTEQTETTTRDPYIEQAIQEARDGRQDREPEREPQHESANLDPTEPSTDQAEQNGRDPYVQQAIDEARERQESWEQGIDPDRDNDRGYGIE